MLKRIGNLRHPFSAWCNFSHREYIDEEDKNIRKICLGGYDEKKGKEKSRLHSRPSLVYKNIMNLIIFYLNGKS